MQISLNLVSSSIALIFIHSLLIQFLLVPLVSCFSYDSTKKDSSLQELSPEMKSHVMVHGILLWASMGFLMPVGILIIRISGREQRNSTRAKLFFYLHVIFQSLSVLIGTAGAVMSLKNFENSFNNNHQRVGLALYTTIWIQLMIGFFRPKRGNKGRKIWYMVHWILGTMVSLVGIVNIYTGLEAYNKRTLRSTRLWTIFFTMEISLISLLYLFQDKKEYIENQGLILEASVSPDHQDESNNVIVVQNKENRLVPQPCGKGNALRNLFD